MDQPRFICRETQAEGRIKNCENKTLFQFRKIGPFDITIDDETKEVTEVRLFDVVPERSFIQIRIPEYDMEFEMPIMTMDLVLRKGIC